MSYLYILGCGMEVLEILSALSVLLQCMAIVLKHILLDDPKLQWRHNSVTALRITNNPTVQVINEENGRCLIKTSRKQNGPKTLWHGLN